MKKTIKYVSIVIASMAMLFTVVARQSYAAATITVNSKADTQANDGFCTLREAVTSANTDTASGAAVGECQAGSGLDTINFAITGTPDFTINSQSGYSIKPTNTIAISSQVIINGYSQTGSAVNTNTAPQSLNSRILIEINGQNAGMTTGFNFTTGSENSTLRGLVINNFADKGVIIGRDNVSIQGSYIGTDPEGLVAAPNSFGIIPGTNATNAKIGGTSPGERNLISGNSTEGVSLQGASSVVTGNLIGTDVSGTNALPNVSGIGVFQPSANISQNVIAGNTGTGVYSNAVNVNVAQNLIGTDITGTLSLGNATGVTLDSASVDADLTNNTISGNTNNGLEILSANANVQNNKIGTDIDGAVGIANNVGVVVSIGGIDSTISNNIVSGNSTRGLAISAPDTLLENNKIGTNDTGNSSIPNSVGVYLGTDAEGSVVSNNIISGNSNFGIEADAADITVQNNKIGTNTAGNNGIGNGRGVVTTSTASGAIVADNVISGNTIVGIEVGGPESLLQSNFIGTNAAGSAAIANDGGVNLVPGANDTIVSNNLISGNNTHGLMSGADGVTISTNLIGVNILGTSPLPNLLGIAFDSPASNVTINMNNVISANTDIQISVSNGGDNLTIEDSIIGLASDGVTDLSSGAGISLTGSEHSILRNVISGNDQGNINFPALTLATIQSNKIGTDASGGIVLSYTQGPGIVFSGLPDSINDNLIGGTSVGQGNIIANNSGAGIIVAGINATAFSTIFNPLNNQLLGNSIFGNKAGLYSGLQLPGLGIDLMSIELDGSFAVSDSTGLGPNANDIGDADTGPNNNMNFPELHSVVQNQQTAEVNFTVDAADSPNDEYRIEFFANDGSDTSGYGEGQTYLGSVNTSNAANKNVSFTLPTGVNLVGKHISATTTAVDGNTDSGFGSTSEFGLTTLATVSSNPLQLNSILAATGFSRTIIMILGTAIVVASGVILLRKVVLKRA